MNTKTVFAVLTSAALISVASAVVIHKNASAPGLPSGAQSYVVRGIVRGVSSAEQTIRIAHEEIPGYMAAMTMPFSVKDSRVIKGIKTGDPIEFDLIVTEDDSWISRIEKRPHLKDKRSPEQSDDSDSSPVNDLTRLNAGERVPDFSLINERGEKMKLTDFRGKAVVLTFVYTRCPIPNFCPLMSKNFVSLQERLEKEFPGRFQLLSVTIDPEFDTPEVLEGYASRYRVREDNWTFATGTLDQILEITGLFGLTREPENGLIGHDLRTALIDSEGRLVHVWKGNAWTPYEIARMVQEQLSTVATR